MVDNGGLPAPRARFRLGEPVTDAERRRTKLEAIPLHERFLLDEETASIMCGVSRPQFRKWVKAGLLRPIQMPDGERRKLYRREDVRTFVDALEVA